MAYTNQNVIQHKSKPVFTVAGDDIRLNAPEDMTAREISSGHQDAEWRSFEVHVYKFWTGATRSQKTCWYQQWADFFFSAGPPLVPNPTIKINPPNMLFLSLVFLTGHRKCHLSKGKTKRNGRNKADIQFSAILWSINSEHSRILLLAVVKCWLPDFSQAL